MTCVNQTEVHTSVPRRASAGWAHPKRAKCWMGVGHLVFGVAYLIPGIWCGGNSETLRAIRVMKVVLEEDERCSPLESFSQGCFR